MKPKTLITPAIYTILSYGFIRLIDDTYAHSSYFFRAPVYQIIMEIVGFYFMFLLIYRLQNKLKDSYNKFIFKQLDKKIISLEFIKAFLICLAVINLTAIPMVSITYDGLQFWDLVEINMIPSFVVILHYSITRVNYYIGLFIKNSIEIEKIKSEQLVTELKFLKGQIQPHFLFNALNTIYFQMDESTDGAKKTIEKLSKMLRYRLYDQQEEQTTLKEEFEYLENYIDLQNTRYSGQLAIEVNLDKSIAYLKIYPFLMLPLVENAFKYVGGKNLIKIDTSSANGNFTFSIFNSIENGIKDYENKGGIGIENLRKRLHLLYPQKHELVIEKKKNEFMAQLKIKLM